MISSSYNNGVSQTRAYNSDNTLASITHAGAAIGNGTYSQPARQIRHENKNKTAEAVSGVLSGFGFTVPASGYDGEDRLTAWNRSDNALSKAWDLSLVGDWNSVTENAQTQARTHGPTHELLSAAGQLIEHDVKGNTTKIPAILRTTDAANPQPDLNLSWDFDNRMRSASDGAVTVSYSFDALGRRVARTDSATTVVYVQTGQQTVADYVLGTAAASPMYTYTYASYIDEPVMRTGTGGDRYYHRNQQYSVVALTNGGGAITERYAYDAYGTPTILDASGTSLTTSADNNRYTYTGREYDEALGLYHYRARMYDSVAGRFCSRDPIGFEGSQWGLYEYGFGNPIFWLDASGLKASCAPDPDVVPRGDRGGHNGGDTFTMLGTRVRYIVKMKGRIEGGCVRIEYSMKPVSRGGGRDSGGKQFTKMGGVLCPACGCKEGECVANPEQPKAKGLSKSFDSATRRGKDKVDADGKMDATPDGNSIKVCYEMNWEYSFIPHGQTGGGSSSNARASGTLKNCFTFTCKGKCCPE